MNDEELLNRQESLVVLGEPGMGKSCLLRRLADNFGVALVTARQLINRPDPMSLVGNTEIVVVDGLDEVAAWQEGYAVDLLIQKLGVLGYPRFILSCRVADWQAATSTATISEQYGDPPLQVHLEPLDQKNQLAILSEAVGDTRANELMAHFESHGLDFLGNPQTLEMIARLPAEHPLPETTTELFELAINTLRVEHREGPSRQDLSRAVALDAAGAAFAALIISGGAAIRRAGQGNLEEGEIPFAEIDALCEGRLDQILGTRLFAGGKDRFTYWHRRIGEFLAADWLTKRADTAAKRRRLLQLFHGHGLVPASLRGLHAWLARDHFLADQVVAADPMGVIEYGDPEILSGTQSRVLLAALETLARLNPHFWRGGTVRGGALVAAQLADEVRRIMLDRDAPFGLRILLLDQLTDSVRSEPYRETLRDLLLDSRASDALRWRAGHALANLNGEDWPALVGELRLQATEDSSRLAYQAMQDVGLDAFSDRQVADVVLTHAGLIVEAWPEREERAVSARFWQLENMVPVDRVERLLDVLVDELRELLPEYPDLEVQGLLDAVRGLVLRRMERGGVDPLHVWRWLQTTARHAQYARDRSRALTERLREDDQLRRAIQLHVLRDPENETIWDGYVRLEDASEGLLPDEGDVVAWIDASLPNSLGEAQVFDWLRLIPHDAEKGRAARAAALLHLGESEGLRDRLDVLANPPEPEWRVEDERRRQQEEATRTARIAENRSDFQENIDRVRVGDFRWVHSPAKAYLNRYHDLNEGLPPMQRVAEWLGPEIAVAAQVGFEAFLTTQPPHPNATRMALSFARHRQYHAGEIIVAALAERVRLRAQPFDDLPDERLMAGLFHLWGSAIEDDAGISGLADQFEVALRERGAWEAAIRLFFVPQLRQRNSYVPHLYAFIRSDRDIELAAALAIEWLQRFPDLPAETEVELIDRALHSSRRFDLVAISDARRNNALDDERRRNWDAVQVILDLEGARIRLHGTMEPDLLWHIRHRISGRRGDGYSPLTLSTGQVLWMVTTFRTLWPRASRPPRMSSGDTNPWDATSFLYYLATKIGEDTSVDATTAIAALVDAQTDGYTDHIRAVAAEQQRRRVEQEYTPPTVQEIEAVVNGGAPRTAADLQASILAALEQVQGMLRGSDVDWYRGFFREEGRHKDEEPCRDEIIKMLRTVESGLVYFPESHGADDKRVDIVAQATDRLILPIEVKGQWHRDLWTDADDQLDQLYVNDWRAERGIYLVLWFGEGERITTPPGEIPTPQSPAELKNAIRDNCRVTQERRVGVVVLDLCRP